MTVHQYYSLDEIERFRFNVLLLSCCLSFDILFNIIKKENRITINNHYNISFKLSVFNMFLFHMYTYFFILNGNILLKKNK